MQLCLLAIFLSVALCSSLGRYLRYGTFKQLRYPSIVRPPLLPTDRFPPLYQRDLTSGRHKAVINLNTIISRSSYPELYTSHYEAELSYFHNQFSDPIESVEAKMKMYENYYGSAINGFAIEMGVDPYFYENYLIRRTRYDCIQRDENLIKMLKSLEADIVISTDASPRHAEKILTRLGIMSLVHVIFASKPGEAGLPLKGTSALAAFDRMESFLGVPPSLISYIDDSNSDLCLAGDLGWNPIWVNHGVLSLVLRDVLSNRPAIQTIYDLPMVLKSSTITPVKE